MSGLDFWFDCCPLSLHVASELSDERPRSFSTEATKWHFSNTCWSLYYWINVKKSYFLSELSSINTCSRDLLMTLKYRSKFWADHSILTARCTQIITVFIPYTTPTFHHRSWRACMVKIGLETTYWAISYHLEMRKFVYLRFRNWTFCHIFATELFFLRWQK